MLVKTNILGYKLKKRKKTSTKSVKPTTSLHAHLFKHKCALNGTMSKNNFYAHHRTYPHKHRTDTKFLCTMPLIRLIKPGSGQVNIKHVKDQTKLCVLMKVVCLVIKLWSMKLSTGNTLHITNIKLAVNNGHRIVAFTPTFTTTCHMWGANFFSYSCNVCIWH